MRSFVFGVCGMVLGLLLMCSGMAHAQQLVPGPADSTRIEPPVIIAPPQIAPKKSPAIEAPSAKPSTLQGQDFVLNNFAIDGATVFTSAELGEDFVARIGQRVTVSAINDLIARIDKRYKEAGYFLSHAQIGKASNIKKGVIHLQVIEGYIGQVVLQDDGQRNHVVQGYIDRITQEKPLNYATLESALLSLDDLPGQSFRAVLSKNPASAAGESELTLIPRGKKLNASVGFDNTGSRFLGPYQTNMYISGSVFQLNETSLYGLNSIPFDALNFGTVHHSYTALPDVILDLGAGVTRAHPAYTLEPLDIESFAVNADAGIKYQWIRQRRENLSTKLDISMRNVNSDIAGAVLTEEQERVVHVGVQYDNMDDWFGSNVVNLKYSQGIDGLGASQAGDLNLSRAQAIPDFRKLELNISRLQELSQEWSALAKASGQVASGPLFSSEEFGYGGENFGRAYDNSEIVGDHGFDASLEIRYDGLRSSPSINFQPYAFYDYGYVVNDDIGQIGTDTAASAGIGVRLATEYGQSGSFGIAFPINHSVLAPLYSKDRFFPRIMFQLSQNF